MLSVVESPNTMMLILRLVLSLGLVLALVGAVTWVLKRRGLLSPGGSKAATGRLEILDRKSLSKHASLVVARVGGVAVLVGVTEQHVNLLSSDPDLAAAWRAAEEVELTQEEAAEQAAALAGQIATLKPASAPIEIDHPADAAVIAHTPAAPVPVPVATATPATPVTATLPPADFPIAETVVDLEELLRLTGASAPSTEPMITEARRTGLQVDAAYASTTTSGMSFIEALRELTVRRS